MSLPIKELIALDLLGVLNGVQVDAGFNTNLNAERVDELSNTPGDSKAVLYEESEVREESPSYGRDGYFVTFKVRSWGVDSEDGGISPDRRLAIICGDIIKAVMIDPHRNNKAYNTKIAGIKTYPQNEPPAVDVSVEVHYRTALNDPFNEVT